ncbi:hypothetical protein NA57DRAFT_70589 [Rhizodiscina lignyota]|uniref:Uncharacterized protein n=1 Tax=Rhizodiscina lignyota TaxID=1504668 RepID=A0A9P4MEE4_9PEZI|nr:hypothetical protein NA57DRAFT_70589 [Rhizodiscina lignyota]
MAPLPPSIRQRETFDQVVKGIQGGQGLSKADKAGIGVGATVGTFLFTALIYLCWRYLKQRKERRAQEIVEKVREERERLLIEELDRLRKRDAEAYAARQNQIWHGTPRVSSELDPEFDLNLPGLPRRRGGSAIDLSGTKPQVPFSTITRGVDHKQDNHDPIIGHMTPAKRRMLEEWHRRGLRSSIGFRSEVSAAAVPASSLGPDESASAVAARYAVARYRSRSAEALPNMTHHEMERTEMRPVEDEVPFKSRNRRPTDVDNLPAAPAPAASPQRRIRAASDMSAQDRIKTLAHALLKGIPEDEHVEYEMQDLPPRRQEEEFSPTGETVGSSKGKARLLDVSIGDEETATSHTSLSFSGFDFPESMLSEDPSTFLSLDPFRDEARRNKEKAAQAKAAQREREIQARKPRVYLRDTADVGAEEEERASPAEASGKAKARLPDVSVGLGHETTPHTSMFLSDFDFPRSTLSDYETDLSLDPWRDVAQRNKEKAAKERAAQREQALRAWKERQHARDPDRGKEQEGGGTGS